MMPSQPARLASRYAALPSLTSRRETKSAPDAFGTSRSSSARRSASGLRRDRASLEHEEVEHRVARRARARGAAALQQLETRDAVFIERYQLAVEHEISIG